MDNHVKRIDNQWRGGVRQIPIVEAGCRDYPDCDFQAARREYAQTYTLDELFRM